ncbi:MAG: cysteine desulfurase NifS [Armatimonadota bacterium]
MYKVIYLDHAATTPTDPEVLQAMLPYFTDRFGSASTLYSLGKDAKSAVEEARESVALLIGAKPDEIYFTSGGTESDNWALTGAAFANEGKGNHIITSKIEHHAILETCHFLEKHGFTVTYLPVDKDGMVDPEDVERAITDRTIIISVMHANNEIGTIQPVEEIGKIARARNIIFHTDTVQAVGSIPVDVNEIGCDALSISAHKLYGPKGVGAMYLRKGTKIQRFMMGGGQEMNRRAGTHNVPGIVGLGKAAKIARESMGETGPQLTALRDKLIDGILAKIPDVRLNGHRSRRLPNNVNVSFDGIEGESIILLLDMHGICASSGSACTSGSLDPSHVLMSLGLKHEEAHGSLRLTLGRENTEWDVKNVLEALPVIVERLRMMSPLYSAKKAEGVGTK